MQKSNSYNLRRQQNDGHLTPTLFSQSKLGSSCRVPCYVFWNQIVEIQMQMSWFGSIQSRKNLHGCGKFHWVENIKMVFHHISLRGTAFAMDLWSIQQSLLQVDSFVAGDSFLNPCTLQYKYKYKYKYKIQVQNTDMKTKYKIWVRNASTNTNTD